MKIARVLMLLLACVSLISAEPRQDNVAQKLVGAWRLVSVEGTDPALTMRVVTALKKALGTKNVVEIEPVMGSEDFGVLGLEGHQIPTMMFRVGAIDADRIAKSNQTGVPLPSMHSSLFWPAPEPTIRTGVAAMTTAALDLMGK